MDSPFPGMDPFLERFWPSVDTQLVAAANRVLNRCLPDDLVARPEERWAIASNEDLERMNTVVAIPQFVKKLPLSKWDHYWVR